MKPLKEAVRQHLDGQQLSQAQLARLMALQGRRRLRLWGALAAGLALVALLLLRQGDQEPQAVWAIAQEVARNHIKMKPLEVESGELVDLQRYFTELAFSPVQSQRFEGRGPLLGGRYCSIQGEDAAQLRFLNDGGRLITLYQAPFDPAKHQALPRAELGEAPLERYADGVRVRIWVEKDLLMVSAEGDPGR
ncbi:hypothetical protein [Gallaecimonas sp. GXIMD4217]|uniref:hypothetical protein n=1 Tax=Gallaecimonas sp. GXIMD4217 TaxID=3131927 RepID=UPI00311B20B6